MSHERDDHAERPAPHTIDPDDAGGGAPAAGDPPPDEIAKLRQERDEIYDRLLRKTAEFDNYRKRTERERRDIGEFASAEVLRDMLPVVDDLERALRASSAADDIHVYRHGIELILKRLNDALRKRGVVPIEAKGQEFDPHLHQAVTREPSTTHRDGEIVEEFERGYLLGERLLRPAMVKVATRE